MAVRTEYCLLGPLIVRRDGVDVPVPPGKQRAVLAVLLLSSGRIVPVDEIAETLWGSAPPPSARVTVRNYVKRLRQALGDSGRALIMTQPPGYLMGVRADDLDVSRFEALAGAAQSAARRGQWDTTATQASAALALWRGEPLADVESERLAAREAPLLAEIRLQALEARIDADLRLGRCAEVIAELQLLAGDHPLREHLHAQLMLAYYWSGRQAEALAVYQHARQVLREELGAEPGGELRELHQQMLAADPDLAAPAAGRLTAAGSGPPVPAESATPQQLPATVAHFTGRRAELQALTGVADQGGPGGRTAVISGTAGVGKTALAVHWGQRAAHRFPDGQLYVNLRGYDPDQPMSAADALAGLLRALGVAGAAIPATVDERAARYRSLLASRRMLVVLDNAGTVDQVRPLLPGTSACVAVVTSRSSLGGLVARDGARRIALNLLPPAEATSLLRALIGPRVDAEAAAAAALAAQCAQLPLALRVAAELAATRATIPLADLVGELADQQRRLDLLDADGDSRTAVRAVFSWSYRHLPAAAARAFRLLGLHPAADLDAYAAAALTGTAVEQARHLLDQLTRVHLIQPTRPGRYGLHDLLRAYARELAAARDGQDHGQAALTRLFDHYLDTAAAAADTLFPADRRHRPRLSPPAAAIPPVTGDPVAARAWLDAERTGLAAVAAHSAGNGWPGHATRLAVTLFRYLETGGHCPEASTIHTYAREAARRTVDAAAEATALTGLGIVAATQGRWLEAISQFADALDLYRGCGDRAGETRALGNLGIMNLRLGRYRAAAGHLGECLLLCRETGDRAAEARTLGNLGIVDLRLGRYEQAIDHLRRAVELASQAGSRNSEARLLGNLGLAFLRRGRHEQANDCFARALSLSRDVGDWVGEAYALGNFGDLQLRRGLYQQSADHFRQALDLFRRVGDQSGEAEILSGRTEPGLPCRFPPQAWRRGRTLLLPARHRCRHLRRRRKRPARRRRVRRYHDDHSLLSGSQGVSPNPGLMS